MCTMYGGLPDEFPKLRFAYVEAGAGWLPFWIERITEHYERRAREVPKMKRAPRIAERADFCTREPDESTLESGRAVVRRGCAALRVGLSAWDSNFDSVNAIRTRAALSESAREKILGGNARRLFGPLVFSPSCLAISARAN